MCINIGTNLCVAIRIKISRGEGSKIRQSATSNCGIADRYEDTKAADIRRALGFKSE